MRTLLAVAAVVSLTCACGRESSGGEPRARKSEAELNLNAIGKAAKVAFHEDAAFPVATAPLTPARPCCEGPKHKCEPVSTDWVGVAAWEQLDFELTEPSFFQYSYSGTATTFVAEAVGDLDCDGETVTYTLRGRVVEGNPVVELTAPTNRD